MEDEEEDLPLPSHRISGVTNRAGPSENSTLSPRREGRMPLIHTVPFDMVTGSNPAPPGGTAVPLLPPLHSTVGLGLVSSSTGSTDGTRSLIHSEQDFVPHLPAVPEPDLPPAREEEQEERMSMEVQIGRKLRQIGDQFQQEHLEMFMQYRRDQLPVWWRLASTLFDLLFPREAFGAGGAQR